MKILFLSYWSLNDGLTQATVLPHLRILNEMKEVDSIHFVTVERNETISIADLPDKVVYHAINSKNYRINLLNKINDLKTIVRHLKQLISDYNIDFLICRSAIAGTVGAILHKRTGVPFAVESFEPHADYMMESGTWKKADPRYLFQKRWEKRQKQSATMLMPVSNYYKKELINEGVLESKIEVMPCAVDLELFKYSDDGRCKIRERLNIPDEAVTGIYVGKFAGIYFDIHNAQEIIKIGFEVFKDFHLIILSPLAEEIKNELQIDHYEGSIHILTVNHEEVPKYLSAADFAYNFHLPHKNSTFFSPIKNGEYWANGLPIIIPDRIGDDSQITKISGFGALLDIDSPHGTYEHMAELLDGGLINDREGLVRELAKEHRSFQTSRTIYKKLIRMIE